MIQAVPQIAAMASYALADLGDASLTSLAQNESAFPPSPRAVQAGQDALGQTHLYPDPDWRDLRAALGAHYPVDPDTVLCGAGSMELIGCLVHAFAGPGDEVLGTEFGYLYVATAVQQAGARYVTAKEPGYTVSTDAILERVTKATKIVFLCNPGNPTGTSIATGEIVALRKALPEDVLLVVDQAYAEFDDQDPAPVFELTKGSNTIVTRTLSKAYGLAGARVGWGVFPPDLATETRKLLNPNNISAASQAMAEAAVQDQTYVKACIAETAKRRDRLATRLHQAGYEVPKSTTSFVLIPFADAQSADRADKALREAGFALRGMGGYGLPQCLRATIGRAEDMDAVAEILETFA